MTHRRRQMHAYVLLTTLVALAGCATTVEVPPRVDLEAYERIGMITLSSNAEEPLQQFATQQLQEAVHSAQPRVRVLELGNEERLLEAIGHTQLNADAIRAIGEKYRVNAVLMGHLDVTEVKPKIRASAVLQSLKSLSAQAQIEASLSGKLLETDSGATAWRNSAHGSKTVAHVSVTPQVSTRVGASDPEDAYGALVQTLAHNVTADFRVRYEKR